MDRRALIRCPACGVETAAVMPQDACVYFWDCPACGTVVKPRRGDCCVFCSYASVACPPTMAEDGAPGSAATRPGTPRPPGGPSREK